MSDHTPIEQSRTYRSLKPTVNRLVQAHPTWRRLRQLTQEYARSPSEWRPGQLIDAADDHVMHRVTLGQVANRTGIVEMDMRHIP
jgi:hypothetical protein